MRGPHEDLESYLGAIDQLRSIISFFSNFKNMKNTDTVLNHANNLLSKAISKLEDEFRNLLTNYRSYFLILHNLSFSFFPPAACMQTCCFNALRILNCGEYRKILIYLFLAHKIHYLLQKNIGPCGNLILETGGTVSGTFLGSKTSIMKKF